MGRVDRDYVERRVAAQEIQQAGGAGFLDVLAGDDDDRRGRETDLLLVLGRGDDDVLFGQKLQFRLEEIYLLLGKFLLGPDDTTREKKESQEVDNKTVHVLFTQKISDNSAGDQMVPATKFSNGSLLKGGESGCNCRSIGVNMAG